LGKTNLLHGKAMIVALVVLGSSLGLASASVPSAFAANDISFYSNPRSATITVDGAVKTYGWTGAYAPGERVRVIANTPAGLWEFDRWIVDGVSVDSPLSQDAYLTIGQGQGSVTAVFQHISIDHEEQVTPPEPPPESPTEPQVD